MTEPLLSLRGLTRHFRVRGGIVHALDGIDLDVAEAETVGLVGESGCGKSTLGKTVMRLLDPTSGSIRLAGTEIAGLPRKALRPIRRQMQMIFQDPHASLNPRLRIGSILEEPLLVHGVGTPAERRERVAWLMQRVGLRPEAAARHPHEFSGGQRQRIGIARALALNPRLIICDEPVSALDVSVRAQVINLLADLKQEFGLSYLFISHDLSVVEHVADRIAVMYLGRIVELADRASLWHRPLHPYTQALISAIPLPDPRAARFRPRRMLEGDLPSPLNPPSGCRFRTRCPYSVEVCAARVPPLRAIASNHQVACHRIETDPISLPGPAAPAESPGTGPPP